MCSSLQIPRIRTQENVEKAVTCLKYLRYCIRPVRGQGRHFKYDIIIKTSRLSQVFFYLSLYQKKREMEHFLYNCGISSCNLLINLLNTFNIKIMEKKKKPGKKYILFHSKIHESKGNDFFLLSYQK